VVNSKLKKWFVVPLVLVAIICAGAFFWFQIEDLEKTVSIASGNGRVEATEIDIATKYPGRVAEILCHEGGFLAEDQVVARMDTQSLQAHPRFSLMGTIGIEALSFEDVFTSGSRKYGIGPSFHWMIFDSRRIRQNIEVQNALQEQALLSYESSVLGALADVENALVAYANEQMRRQALVEGAQAAQRAVTLSQNQYTSGLIDFQNVLNAQRALFSLQSQQAQSDAAVTSNLISLYKALGGGWASLEPALVN